MKPIQNVVRAKMAHTATAIQPNVMHAHHTPVGLYIPWPARAHTAIAMSRRRPVGRSVIPQAAVQQSLHQIVIGIKKSADWRIFLFYIIRPFVAQVPAFLVLRVPLVQQAFLDVGHGAYAFWRP